MFAYGLLGRASLIFCLAWAGNAHAQLGRGFGSGADGDLTVTTTVVPTLTAYVMANHASGSTSLQLQSAPPFAPGQEIIIYQVQGGSPGTYEFNTVSSIAGNAVQLGSPLAHDYASGSGPNRAIVGRVPNYSSVTVAAGGKIASDNWNGQSGGLIVFRSSGRVAVLAGGTIDGSGQGYRGGNAVSGSNPGFGQQGESFTGTGALTWMHNAGGGGGSYENAGCCTEGAGGGAYGTQGAAGIDGSAHGPGEGGGSYGTPDGATIQFGSGGGSGECANAPRPGGNGGGVVIIFAPIVSVTGLIRSNGGDGTPSCWGGGGGGAGGFIGLVADSVALGQNRVTALGGTAGSGGGGDTNTAGGAGGFGRIVIFTSRMSGRTVPLPYANGAPCVDADHDGVLACAGDCDDSDPRVKGGGREICDGIDNDCDGLIDNAPFACGAAWDTLVARPFTSAVPLPKAIAFGHGGAYGRYMYVLSDYHDIYRVDSTGVASLFGRTRADNRANAVALVFDETTEQRYGGYLFAILDNTGDPGTPSGGIDRIMPDGTAQVFVQGAETSPRLIGTWDGVIDDVGRFDSDMFVSDFESDENGSASTVIRISPQAGLSSLGSGGLRGAMGLDLDRLGRFGGDMLVTNPAAGTPWWVGADNQVYRVAPDGTRTLAISDHGLGTPMDVLVDALGRLNGSVFVNYGGDLTVLYDATDTEQARITIPGASSIGLGQDRWGAFGYDVFCAGTSGVVRITPQSGPHAPLSVETIAPRFGGDTGAVTTLIRGTSFSDGAIATLVGPTEIVPTAIQLREGGVTLEVRFDLYGKTRGAYDVVVRNPDGKSATLPGGFTIEGGRFPDVRMSLLGRPHIFQGRPQRYYLTATNLGNVDAHGCFSISLPQNATWAVAPLGGPVDGLTTSEYLVPTLSRCNTTIPARTTLYYLVLTITVPELSPHVRLPLSSGWISHD